MTKSNVRLFQNCIISLILSFTIILFAIEITLIFKGLYYFDIIHLNIEKTSGLNKTQIILIYNHILNFINSNENKTFTLPILPYSIKAQLHFIEVRNIFLYIRKLLFIFTLFSMLSMNYIIHTYSILNSSSNLLLSICTLIFLILFLNFDTIFTLFHKIVFPNTYWLFDPNKDPIITIFPERFFLHCAILIVSIIVVIALILKVLYYSKVKYHK
ncbi:TIGR01906 family membrane protein [Clostridium fermenticellae]|uniref:TIGR01906 family membrane protein n=1 Tax=Clostridium fermenticellae TaxID=2068654 RepID=A0A386H1A6_9CLOT|nr:TIGR01906 family membrane protein [Clostridium fermenticellae]